MRSKKKRHYKLAEILLTGETIIIDMGEYPGIRKEI